MNITIANLKKLAEAEIFIKRNKLPLTDDLLGQIFSIITHPTYVDISDIKAPDLLGKKVLLSNGEITEVANVLKSTPLDEYGYLCDHEYVYYLQFIDSSLIHLYDVEYRSYTRYSPNVLAVAPYTDPDILEAPQATSKLPVFVPDI